MLARYIKNIQEYPAAIQKVSVSEHRESPRSLGRPPKHAARKAKQNTIQKVEILEKTRPLTRTLLLFFIDPFMILAVRCLF